MRIYLFNQARKIILNDRIERIGTGLNYVHYRVTNSSGKEYNVSVGYERKETQSQLKYTCDCEYMSIQGIPNHGLCSHILAVFADLMGVRVKQESNADGKPK